MHHGFIILSHHARRQVTAATDTNLTSAETNHQISNEGIFCFPRTVTHHHTPTIGLGKLATGRDKQSITSFSFAQQPLLWWGCQAPGIPRFGKAELLFSTCESLEPHSCFYMCLHLVSDMPIWFGGRAGTGFTCQYSEFTIVHPFTNASSDFYSTRLCSAPSAIQFLMQHRIPYPSMVRKGRTYACRDSVTEPIWLTFRSRQLQDFSSTALAIRFGLVTVRSSPTTWMPTLAVNFFQAAQSSWSKGSSMDTTAEGQKELQGTGCFQTSITHDNFQAAHCSWSARKGGCTSTLPSAINPYYLLLIWAWNFGTYMGSSSQSPCTGQPAGQEKCICWDHQGIWSPGHTFHHGRTLRQPHPCQWQPCQSSQPCQ